ncbi:MAG: hypothetical protein HRT88_06055 [Lentisphaeraceae bacterium]|nr:hypothetical protein [Lentisphaeraceae bacterium]
MHDDDVILLDAKPFGLAQGRSTAEVCSWLDHQLIEDQRRVVQNKSEKSLNFISEAIPQKLQKAVVFLLNDDDEVTAASHEYTQRVDAKIEVIPAHDIQVSLETLMSRYDRLMICTNQQTLFKNCPDYFIAVPRNTIGAVGVDQSSLSFQPLCVLSWMHRALVPEIIANLHSQISIDTFADYRVCLIDKKSVERASEVRLFDEGSYDHLAAVVDKVNWAGKTFFPLYISKNDKLNVPMGDALLSVPIALELNMKIFIQEGFVADLLKILVDGQVRLVHDIPRPQRRCEVIGELVHYKNLALALDNWGSPQLFKRFGRINATQAMALALGAELEKPMPQFKRLREAHKGRIIIFPNGSVSARTLPGDYVQQLTLYLQKEGFEVLSSDKVFKNAREYLEFICSAEYVISVFTGPMHLAASLGIKTIAISVGDSPWAYRPLQENVKVLGSACSRCWFEHATHWVCDDRPPICLKDHTPQRILAAIKDLDKKELVACGN